VAGMLLGKTLPPARALTVPPRFIETPVAPRVAMAFERHVVLAIEIPAWIVGGITMVVLPREASSSIPMEYDASLCCEFSEKWYDSCR